MSYKTGRVSSGNVLFIGLSILALLFFYSGNAEATTALYDSNCVSCHPAPTPRTCDGCHAHGVHSSNAKNDFNLSATTDKATYSPGETVTVTFTGGYMDGWIRAYLYDNVGVQVDISTGTNGRGGGAAFPITLTGTAPAAAGTYTFTAAWYGNRFDLAQVGGTTTFGPNWTPDPSNSNHGQEKIATSSFTVTAGADTTAPTVSSTLPDNNATGVAVGSTVTATFNEAIDPATVTTASFLLQAGVDNVAGAVALNGAGTIATFTPSAALADNTTYTATLTTAITDNAANPLAAAYVWTFTASAVADTTAPTVSSTSPDNNATGVAVGSAVTATFDEAIDPATMTTASFLLQAGADNVAGVVALNGAGTIATFTPSAPLQDNTAYTATLTTVITDVSGNPLAAGYVWTFTTAAAVAPSSSDDDDNWFGCAMSPSGGRNGGILGTYGFLLLLALGIALRKRVRRRKE
jgi:MYXO-CTERM domain-containing protein